MLTGFKHRIISSCQDLMVKCLSVELDWISHEYNRIRETLEFLFYSVFSQGIFFKILKISKFDSAGSSLRERRNLYIY